MGPQIVSGRKRVVLSLGMPHPKDTLSMHACEGETAVGEAEGQRCGVGRLRV